MRNGTLLTARTSGNGINQGIAPRHPHRAARSYLTPRPSPLPQLPFYLRGFDPQNAVEPIINVHKLTAKVNITTMVAVVVFPTVGIVSLRWVADRGDHRESSPARETAPAE